MSNQTIARVQPGVPTGGQFAPTVHGDSDICLDALEPAPSAVAKDSVFTQKYETMEEKLAALHGELEAAVTDLATDEGWNAYLQAATKFHRYSFNNQMLIAIQTRNLATRVAGFNRWKELERSVRKGEKAIVILAPKTVTVTERDVDGKPVKGADGKPVRKSFIKGFTTASVFDLSQTDGKPLPSIDEDMELSETPPKGFREDLVQAISDSGFTVSYEKIEGGARGFTSPHDKRVVIADHMSNANQVTTLAHELGHIKAGHLDHMDEYHQGHAGRRGQFEVEAESVAYVISRANGMTPAVGEKSGRYVAGWGGTDGDKVRETAEHVQKTVKDILGGGGFRNAQD